MTLTGVRALFVFSPCAEQGWVFLWIVRSVKATG
jgi:hypothetical protein